MKNLIIFYLICNFLMMMLCEKLNKAELVKYGDLNDNYFDRKISSRRSNRIFYPPENHFIYPPDFYVPPINEPPQNDVHLLKSLKQLINHTKRKLDPKENWSRLDENYDYEPNYDRNLYQKRFEGNFLNTQNSKKKKKNKKCKCECEKDLIIHVPKYKYRDIPLGKEVPSNYLQGNQYESLPINAQSTFENVDSDHDTNESAQVYKTKLKQDIGKNYKRNDFNSQKYKLPDKNLNYDKKRIKNNLKNSSKKSSNSKQANNSKIVYMSDRKTESSNRNTERDKSTNDENYEDSYNNSKNEYEYVDFISQDTDTVDDYNTEDEEDEFIENKDLESNYEYK